MTWKNKAQIFSVITILMSLLFILLFSGATRIPLDKNVVILTSDISTVNLFVDDINSFVDAGLQNQLLQALNYTVGFHAGVNNFSNYTAALESCLYNNTFRHQPAILSNCSNTGENSSLASFLDIYFSQAESIYNVSIDYVIYNLSVHQSRPFFFTVNAVLLVNISRPSFQWSKIINTSQLVTIDGLTDPLSISGHFIRKIHYKPPYGETFDASVSFVSGNSFFDFDKLADYIDNRYYFRDASAPSFVQMMEGNLGSFSTNNNSLGIGSFIPEFNLTSNSNYVQNTSFVVSQRMGIPAEYSCSDLRRIRHDNISTNLLFPYDYLVDILKIPSTNTRLSAVCGCCNASGCIPECGLQ